MAPLGHALRFPKVCWGLLEPEKKNEGSIPLDESIATGTTSESRGEVMGVVVSTTTTAAHILVLALMQGYLGVSSTMEPPEMHKIYVDSNLNLGDQVDLMCSIKRGSPPVAFTWYHNGREIRNEDRLGSFESLQGKSILVVDKITREHIGNYTCAVRNPAGSDSYTVKLYVNVKPTWTNEPQDTSASTSSNVVVHCNSFGYPIPTVRWSKETDDKDFQPVRIGDRYNMAPNGSLQIRSVRTDDAGHFRCDVSNGLGSDLSKVIMLSISSPPKILDRAEVTTVRRSHSVRLKCEATGDRPLAVRWSKDQRPYEGTLREGFDIIERNMPGGVISELLIQNSTSSDTAAYNCQVSNNFGNATAIIKLFVLEPPSPPVGIRVSDVRSRTVRLTWQAPYSEVTTFHVRFWKENAQNRKLTLITVSGAETSVHLSDLMPGTAYDGYMLSENRVGMSGPSTPLHFSTSEEAPTASPMDVQISGLGSSHFKVQWKVPPKDHQNGKIQGYYVGHRLFDSPMLPYTFQTVNGADTNQAVVRGLQINTRYSAVVQAFNAAGAGPSSHQLVLTTLEEDLPEAPPFLVTEVTCCSATLSIKEKKRRSLTQYVLDYRARNGLWRSIYFPSYTVSVCLENLSRMTPYEVTLAAYNMHGRGEPSEPVPFATTAEEPSSVADGEVTGFQLLEARVLVPVLASLVIIVSSVVVAYVCYKKLVSKKDPLFLYQSATLRKPNWEDREYATIARTTIRRRVEEAYDVPWDMDDGLQQNSKIVEDCYTLLKKKTPSDHQRLSVAPVQLESASGSAPEPPPKSF